MITFKLNDKNIQVASCWEDLSFNQYCEVFKIGGDLLKLVSLVSGTDYEILKKAKIEGLEGVISAMSFIKKPAVWTDPTLKCGPYTLPMNKDGKYNIEYESLGQFEDTRVLISNIKDTRDIQMICPDIVAIYLQKIRDGEYNPEKAKAMVPEVKEMLAQEVVTLGSFFITHVLNLLSGTQANSQSTAPNPKKLKPVSKGSSRRSARSPRSRK